MKYQYDIVSRWRNKHQVEELKEKIRSKGKTVYSFIEGDGTHYELKDDEQNHEPEEFMKNMRLSQTGRVIRGFAKYLILT